MTYSRSNLLTRQFGGIVPTKTSDEAWHITVCDSNYFRKRWQNIHYLFAENMENMVIIPWSCHESCRACQEISPPCCHHGMIMEWQPYFSNLAVMIPYEKNCLWKSISKSTRKKNDFQVLIKVQKDLFVNKFSFRAQKEVEKEVKPGICLREWREGSIVWTTSQLCRYHLKVRNVTWNKKSLKYISIRVETRSKLFILSNI